MVFEKTVLVSCFQVLTSRESIFEDLLKPQELEDREVDGRVEPQTTFVGAKGRVVLDTEAIVGLDLEVVVFPDDAELDDPLRDGRDLESPAVLWIFLEKGGIFESRGQFWLKGAVTLVFQIRKVATTTTTTRRRK